MCYYCDDKYNPGHKCKTACFLLVGQEEIDEILQDIEPVDDSKPGEEENHINNMEVTPEISLNALAISPQYIEGDKEMCRQGG